MPDQDPETWMWERARSVLERADRIQRSFFQPGRPGSRPPSWEPPVDVFETETELWVLVALPGVEPERVRVELDGVRVRIRGERVLPAPFRSAVMHRLEIPHGVFERVLELPPERFELARTELLHGCLFLLLKKLV